MRIQILQPLIPHYRVPFFERLISCPDIDVKIVAGKRASCTDSIFSVEALPYADLSHPLKGLVGNRLFWQEGLSVWSQMTPGDVLVLCGNLRYLSNFPLIVGAKRKALGVVWWGHGYSKHPKPLVEKIRWWVMHWVDAVLLYTDAEIDAYVQRGFPPEKLFVTNNTIDQKPIREAIQAWPEEKLGEFRKKENLRERNVLLYCGRIKPSSNLELALQALEAIREQETDCLLAVIGDGEGRTKLGQLAKELGVGENVRWLGAIYDQKRLAPWFLSAAMFVHPGPIGLSLIHSMSYGLPVITHSKRQHHGPEIAALRNRVNGLLFQEGDPKDLAAKIIMLLRDDELRKRLSAEALGTAREDYSMDSMVKRFIEAVHYASQSARTRLEK